MILNRLENENEESYLWRLGQAKDSGLVDYSWNDIADIMNKEFRDDISEYRTETAYRKPYSQAKRFYYAGAFDQKPVVAPKTDTIEDLKVAFGAETSINKDGSYSSKRLIEMSEVQSKDPKYILKAHGFDSNDWEIVSVRNTIRQAISRQNEDGVATLYASYITVKPIKDSYLAFCKIKKFYEELIEDDHRPIIKKNENKQTNLMLEIPIVDVHFGKLSLSEDVAEPYNYNLAKQRFNCVIDDVIDSVKDKQIEKIIFPIGNDFFNIDTYKSTTTAGTQQNCDLSPHLIFKYGVECLIENIIKLTDIAPVEVFCINGNHDFLSSYHALYSIYCYFHNNENVIVNTGTRPRKYIEFGNVLLGFTHGDKEKNRIGGLMQIEAREAWGRTKYHEIHTGHWHSEQITKESGGVIIRSLSSFTGSDLWHNESGYVGAIKKCQSFLWDKNKGLKSIIVSTID